MGIVIEFMEDYNTIVYVIFIKHKSYEIKRKG